MAVPDSCNRPWRAIGRKSLELLLLTQSSRSGPSVGNMNRMASRDVGTAAMHRETRPDDQEKVGEIIMVGSVS
jgi:hypothetical protein